MTVYAYLGSSPQTFQSLGLTVNPGDIIDFGSNTPPAADALAQDGSPVPTWQTYWATSAGVPNATLASDQLPPDRGTYVARLPGTGGNPAMAAGANAGGSPPAPVVDSSSSDMRGGCTFGTGATPAAGAQVVVTLTAAAAFGAAPQVMLEERNSATKSLGLYVTNVTTTSFTINALNAPAASQANNTYSVGYVAIA